MRPGQRSCWTNERGATLVVVGLLMTVLVGFSALAIDIGYLYASKNELQNIADAAALAGAGNLGSTYREMSYLEQQNFNCDPDPIIGVVKDIALSNKAAGVNIVVKDEDVVIGTWKNGSLTPGLSFPDAVRVTVRRDNTLNTPVSTFFAGVLGITLVNISADATAALTGQGSVGKGDLELPIGISRNRVSGDPEDYCGTIIAFSPPTDPDACSGWTDFGTDASVSQPKIQDAIEGDIDNPEVNIGINEFTFTGGKGSTNFIYDPTLKEFQIHGYDVDSQGNPRIDSNGNSLPPLPIGNGAPYGVGDAVPLYATNKDGSYILDKQGEKIHLKYPSDNTLRYDHRWLTSVLVYDSDTCQPNTTYKIIGFVEVEIFDIQDEPDKRILAKIKCDYVDNNLSRGGGGDFGKKGSLAGLVE